MVDDSCLGPGVDRSRISPDAEVSGASYLTGPRTAVGPGAIVRDARLHDVVIESGAVIVDSVFLASGAPAVHKCDAAGRTVVSGAEQPGIAEGAHVSGSTLINTSVGRRSRVSDTWGENCRLGADNFVGEAKLVLVETAAHARIVGPTEVSEAYLGHHAVIDKRGYYEGIFSNKFLQVEFDESAGRLLVKGTIDLPHVSVYGVNTVNSTNSGKLLAQPEGRLEGLGPHLGLWRDPLLSHEQVELGPCCWVAPWTKVIGQSPAPHETDEQLVNDELTTYVMPFGVAGFGGELTRGLVMPGELSVGLGPKERKGAWAFTYAPGAVIRMVARLHEALEAGRKHLADTIVPEAIRCAVEMTKAQAARRNVDLSLPVDRQRPGWPRQIARTYALLDVHLAADLWRFEDGRPEEWRLEAGRWTHRRIGRLLAVAPDALEAQVGEAEMFACQDPVPPVRVALPQGALDGTAGRPEIDPAAEVSPGAFVGPGCKIGPGCTVAEGASVWNSVLRGCRIGADCRIERSVLTDSRIGARSTVRSSRLTEAAVADDADLQAARLVRVRLAPKATISAFADLEDVRTNYGTILGGIVRSAEIDTYLMSMHMAGACSGLEAVATEVELDGRRVAVPAIPMLGGGCLIRGKPDAPVRMECCFIGSNAIIEAGTYVGFGCFVLGGLGPDAGLPPFTVSTGGGPAKHQIGAALGSLASTVITHFVNWTYQAVGPGCAPAVAVLVRQAIRDGIAAMESELAGRAGRQAGGGTERHCRYKSLSRYSDRQLQAGLKNYRRALESGAWEMAYQDGQLSFTSPKGRWVERQGAAFWQSA